MVHNLICKISNMDKSIVKIVKIILKISFFICMASILILSLYISSPVSHITYLAGLKLFKSSLMIAVFGIICGIAIDSLKN